MFDSDITLSAEEREIGGLGIFITKKTMETITYAYENIITMIKKLNLKEIYNYDYRN